jgi:hypothetical protein
VVLSFTSDLGAGGSFRSSKGARARAMVGDKSGNDILEEGLTTLRSLCLQSFPELFADIKLAALPTAVGNAGSVDVNAGRFWISLSRYVTSYSSPFEWDIEDNIKFTTM